MYKFTEKELNQYNKKDLIYAILFVIDNEPYSVIKNVLTDIKHKRLMEKNEKLYNESMEVEDLAIKSFNSLYEFEKNMIENYNVPCNNGKFNCYDLFKLVPANVIDEYIGKIEAYNKAFEKSKETGRKFMNIGRY